MVATSLEDPPFSEQSPVKSSRIHPWVMLLALTLVVMGLVSRTAPLISPERQLWQHPTEDGYLMLTMARNIALGRGLSTAGGLLPTNGTQPLMTFLLAPTFWLGEEGDRWTGVVSSQVILIGVALASVGLLYALGRVVVANHPHRGAIAALGAGAWFASAGTVRHSMNCLETGLYMFLVVASVYAFACWSRDAPHRWGPARIIGMGLLLGLTFLARNDATFLIAAVCLARALQGIVETGGSRVRPLLEAIGFGAISILVAAPWLIYNQLFFGSVMPISGQAQSLEVEFAKNAYLVPTHLVEYLSVVGLIPNHLNSSPTVIAGTTAMLLALAPLVVITVRRSGPVGRWVIVIVTIFAILLSGFYGLRFGAGHFISRYLAPLSPFLALWTVFLVVEVYRLLGQSHSWRVALAVLAGLGTVGLVTVGNVREYLEGPSHLHRHVIQWVDENVPPETWVAAVQTGTLGFFHERTINLDGKVNPQAMEARKVGRIPEYVVQWRSPEGASIEYIVDWMKLSGWQKYDPIARHFDLVVLEPDPGNGLSVFQRQSISGASGEEAAESPLLDAENDSAEQSLVDSKKDLSRQ